MSMRSRLAKLSHAQLLGFAVEVSRKKGRVWLWLAPSSLYVAVVYRTPVFRKKKSEFRSLTPQRRHAAPPKLGAPRQAIRASRQGALRGCSRYSRTCR